jgi:hypothetical protein
MPSVKRKLVLINLSLAVYLTGLLSAAIINIKAGAIFVLIASILVVIFFIVQVLETIRERQPLIFILGYLVGALCVGEIFLTGFSIAIGKSLFSIPGVFFGHVFCGALLCGLFIWLSVAQHDMRHRGLKYLFVSGLGIFGFFNLMGYLGFAGILHGMNRLLYFSFVFLIFFYLLYFIVAWLIDKEQDKREKLVGMLLCALMVIFWFLRWQVPDILPRGLYRIAFMLGFVIIILLPLSWMLIRKVHFVTTFFVYFILIDSYFLAYDNDFKYLVNVGTNECVGYNDATDYPVVRDPGVTIEELFQPPSEEELYEISSDWERRDFNPMDITVVYAERKSNGDSIKVVSHRVQGKLHYGMIRIPMGIDLNRAPILMALNGGGSDIDIFEEGDLNRLSSGMCRDVLDKYITIAPAFRGDIVRGENFCFRAEGYTGDVWLGAAEDAISFLEVVKRMYTKGGNTKVLAFGVSRGATVALIIGALTNKLNYIISIATHTNFHQADVFKNERVGADFPKIFFTPKAPLSEIRKRLISCSPYYFAGRLPAFEVHQGSEDYLTTVFHARVLHQRMVEIGTNDSSYHIYVYEGKGHAYDDDRITCKSLREFAVN